MDLAPKIAVSPFAGLLWRTESALRFDLHNMFSIVRGAPFGIYDRTVVAVGFASNSTNISFGPSLSIYWMPVCNTVICTQVTGLAPGIHAQTDWFITDHWGASVGGNIDWTMGSSRVLSSGAVLMTTAGPIFGIGAESK